MNQHRIDSASWHAQEAINALHELDYDGAPHSEMAFVVMSNNLTWGLRAITHALLSIAKEVRP